MGNNVARFGAWNAPVDWHEIFRALSLALYLQSASQAKNGHHGESHGKCRRGQLSQHKAPAFQSPQACLVHRTQTQSK